MGEKDQKDLVARGLGTEQRGKEWEWRGAAGSRAVGGPSCAPAAVGDRLSKKEAALPGTGPSKTHP